LFVSDNIDSFETEVLRVGWKTLLHLWMLWIVWVEI